MELLIRMTTEEILHMATVHDLQAEKYREEANGTPFYSELRDLADQHSRRAVQLRDELMPEAFCKVSTSQS